MVNLPANHRSIPGSSNPSQMWWQRLSVEYMGLTQIGRNVEADRLLGLVSSSNGLPDDVSEIRDLLSITGGDVDARFNALVGVNEKSTRWDMFENVETATARVAKVFGPKNSNNALIKIDLGLDWKSVKSCMRRFNKQPLVEDKERLLTLIQIMVMSIIVNDKDLYDGDVSKMKTARMYFEKPYFIDGERVSLQKLCSWSMAILGRKEDGSKYSISEIAMGWKRGIYKTRSTEKKIQTMPVDVGIPPLEKMTLGQIRSLVWMIVMYDKALYYGDASNLKPWTVNFAKPYLFDGIEISLQELYTQEKRIRGKKENGSEYSRSEIIKDWQWNIFGIEMLEKKADVIPIDIKIPPLKEMTLLHIHSLVWSIVMYDKRLYDGDGSKLSSYVVKFIKPYLMNGIRISLQKLYEWEKRVRGKKQDGSEYSIKEIINIWRNDIVWNKEIVTVVDRVTKKAPPSVPYAVNVVKIIKHRVDDPTLTPILNNHRLLKKLIKDNNYRLKIKGLLLKRWIRPYEHNVGKTILLINKLRDEIENEDVKALIEEVVNEIGEYSEMKASGR